MSQLEAGRAGKELPPGSSFWISQEKKEKKTEAPWLGAKPKYEAALVERKRDLCWGKDARQQAAQVPVGLAEEATCWASGAELT